MQNPLIHIVRSVFGRPRLGDVPREELHLLTQRHPYSAPLHLLYAKRLLEQVDTRYPDAVSLAAIHFTNPHWLQQQLRSDDGVADREEETDLPTGGHHPAEGGDASGNHAEAVAGAGGDTVGPMAADTVARTAGDPAVEVEGPATLDLAPPTLPGAEGGPEPPGLAVEDEGAQAEVHEAAGDGGASDAALETLPGGADTLGVDNAEQATTAIDIGSDNLPEADPEAGIDAAAPSGVADADTAVDTPVDPTGASDEDPESVAVPETPAAIEEDPTAMIEDTPSVAEPGGMEEPAYSSPGASEAHDESDLIHVSMPEDLEGGNPEPTEGEPEPLPAVEGIAPIGRDEPTIVGSVALLAGAGPADAEAGGAFELPVEPLHLTDYFASQGIEVGSELEFPIDPSPRRSFSGWLRTMKRLQPDRDAAMLNEQEEAAIRTEAEASNLDEDVVTEAMAEVYARQGLVRKAIAVYEKLGLLDPDRSATFADRISQLKGQLP
jgi:hypothetical protein